MSFDICVSNGTTERARKFPWKFQLDPMMLNSESEYRLNVIIFYMKIFYVNVFTSAFCEDCLPQPVDGFILDIST